LRKASPPAAEVANLGKFTDLNQRRKQMEHDGAPSPLCLSADRDPDPRDFHKSFYGLDKLATYNMYTYNHNSSEKKNQAGYGVALQSSKSSGKEMPSTA